MIDRPAIAGLAALVLVAGCSTADVSGAPSLGPRPIEQRSEAITTPPPAPIPAAGAELAARIAQLREAVERGRREFEAAFGPAERQTRAAAGAGVGSDPWVRAQTAISGLEGARASSSIALTNVEALIAERIQGGDDAGLVELAALREDAATVAGDQASRIDALAARLQP